MGPKKAAADKKELFVEIEENDDVRCAVLEEEIRDLRQKLTEADEEIAETKLQAINDSKKLAGMLKQYEQDKEEVVRLYQQKMSEMSQEKDKVIHDMQATISVLRDVNDNTQRPSELRVHYRDDDTVILPRTSPSSHSYVNDSVAERNRTPQNLPRPFSQTTRMPYGDIESNQRRRNELPPMTPLFSAPDPWQDHISRAAIPKYEIPLPRQLVFDGKMSWDSFIIPFVSTAMVCRWTEEEKLFRLTSSLRGEAAEYVFNQLSTEITRSFDSLIRALESRFRERRTSASYLNELENRKLLGKERLLEYVADIKRLVIKGYPTADELTRETISVRYFLRGLSDQQLAVSVGMKDPKTIDDAREMVETYNSLRDDVSRSQRVRSVKFEGVQEKEGESQRRQQKQPTKVVQGCITAEDVEKIIEMKLKEVKKDGEAQNEVRDKIQINKKNKGYINRNHIECFKCHKLGHYANECDNVDRKKANELRTSPGN